MVFYRGEQIEVFAGSHAGKKGTWVKWNGGRDGDGCVCLLSATGQAPLAKVFLKGSQVRVRAAAPAAAPAHAQTPAAAGFVGVSKSYAAAAKADAGGDALARAGAPGHEIAAQPVPQPAPRLVGPTQVEWAQRIMSGALDPAVLPPAQDWDGYVYLMRDMRDPGRVKVGHAKNVDKRAAAGRTWLPELRVEAVFYCADRKRAERIAHAMLEPHRLRNVGGGNEWFACSVARASIACVRAAMLCQSP